MIPKFKVTIDGTDYENDVFNSINIKRRDCNYDVATLVAADPTQALYAGAIQKFDVVSVNLKADTGDAYSLVFGGKVRQVNPTVSRAGRNLAVNCKGYGAALEDTHCSRDYGLESSNPSYHDAWGILANIIGDYAEKSFSGGATGYDFDNGGEGLYISDFCTTDIKYINNPYRANSEVIDIVCNLTSAIGAGATAGGHWIVDPLGRFLFAKIGDHTAGASSPETYWPDWWNTNQAGSTLTEGIDFFDLNVLDKAEEYANHVVLVTDFRRPASDYWTESGFTNGLWDFDGTTCEDDNVTPDPVVGADYLVIENADAWTPANEAAGWDVTRWGSSKTIPRLNFYMYKNDLVNANCIIKMFTTDHSTDYFYTLFSTLNDPDDEWVFKSIPIGPYWATTDEARLHRWIPSSANADWANINGLSFYAVDNGADPGFLCLDDLHFSGKIARSAKHLASIATYGEIQKVLLARNAMDDTCVAGTGAGKDDGFAGRINLAELLRRVSLPQTIIFTIPLKPTMMAGQKCHIHACKKSDGSFVSSSWTNGGDMRILTVEHNIDASGASTTVTATTDLLNSIPINQPDMYAMMMENLFLNSNEAKNIRAGAEVDLLIPRLVSDY
jgi:hypothetical protein